MENETYTHMGFCPECGQIIQVKLKTENPTTEQLQEAALQVCTCNGAVCERRRIMMTAKARDKLHALVGNEKVERILEKAVDLIARNEIDGIVCTCGNERVTVKWDSSKIKIKKQVVHTREESV